MSRRDPIGIRTTLWLAVGLAVSSSVLGTVGLQGYRLLHQSRLTARLRVQAVAETYAAQVAGLMEAGERAKVATLVRELPWHGDSQFLAVFDDRDQVQGVRGEVRLLTEYQRVRQAEPAENVWPVKSVAAGAAVDSMLVCVPVYGAGRQLLGRLAYAMKTQADTSITGGVQFFIYIALIAAAGMALGVLWLKRQVLDPLAMLSANAKGSEPMDDLPVGRDDEIGTLARTLTEMHVSLEEWRQRAVRLERSIDDRVAHETQRITRELKKAERQIWTDALTRLSNRRVLDEKFGDIFRAQRESGQDLSVVMIDVDNFKQLNDTMGHQAGDELLTFTGELLRQCLREQDLAVRYGGDEFVLILPSVSPEQARAVAERTIAMFWQRTRALALPKRPTMSAGIASLAADRPDSAEQLLKMADAALYQAKSSGKARVEVFSHQMQLVGSKK